MSIHLAARPGDVAETVLLPGDPKRAEHISEQLLQDAVCYNQLRGASGFTGTYRGRPVSVQASGMGMPSMAIYAHELIEVYGVRRLIRIGTCGALQPDLPVGQLILAQGAGTDSGMNKLAFGGRDFAALADWELLLQAHRLADELGLDVRVGGVVTSDSFYAEQDSWRVWADHGVLAAEMETAALYTVAARHRVQALAILTVSDSIFAEASPMTPQDRERSLLPMAELALAVATSS